MFGKKPDPQAAARADDWAIKKVYACGSITLALTRIDTYWSFNKSTPLTVDTQMPLTHRLEPMHAFGVVDEASPHEPRILVNVEFTNYAEKAGVGHCYLERKKGGAPTLRVVLRDPGGGIGAIMAEALKEAAISGNSFQHFRMTVGKSSDLAAVARQISEHEYGPSIDILDIDSLRRVLLPKAPPETWRRQWD